MKSLSIKQIAILIVTLAVVAVGVLLVINMPASDVAQPDEETQQEISDEPAFTHEVIGSSVEGRDIDRYIFGDGETHLLFVGGIHGGYEWNSVLLAYRFIDHLRQNPDMIPSTLTVSIIPSLNPDGIYEIIGKEGRFSINDVPDGSHASGRFNANGVDLNRNFDCRWEPTSTWRGQEVSAGTKAFSEPEAQALREVVMETDPVAAVFWHSQANAVYASECESGIISETLDIMNIYADAGSYRAVESFDAYPITGDAEGWLASLGIPALSVELETHETIEWERNRAGVEALFEYYK